MLNLNFLNYYATQFISYIHVHVHVAIGAYIDRPTCNSIYINLPLFGDRTLIIFQSFKMYEMKSAVSCQPERSYNLSPSTVDSWNTAKKKNSSFVQMYHIMHVWLTKSNDFLIHSNQNRFPKLNQYVCEGNYMHKKGRSHTYQEHV